MIKLIILREAPLLFINFASYINAWISFQRISSELFGNYVLEAQIIKKSINCGIFQCMAAFLKINAILSGCLFEL